MAHVIMVSKIITRTLFLALLLSLATSTALSQNNQGQNNNNQGQNYTRAPEIDPAQVVAALTLLSGTLAIIRGYHRKK
jgi:hypothetical protein